MHLCEMISPGFFYSLIFHVVKQAEGQKMAQNDKKVHLLCIIFLESYIISSFMVHMCKRIRSWGIFFHFFKILVFWIIRWANYVALLFTEIIHHMIVIYVAHVYNDYISCYIFQFFKTLISWVVTGGGAGG